VEYVEDLGNYDDIPAAGIIGGFERVYGRDRAVWWIKVFEEGGENSPQNFAKEDVTTP
jgi:hypothetical protein